MSLYEIIFTQPSFRLYLNKEYLDWKNRRSKSNNRLIAMHYRTPAKLPFTFHDLLKCIINCMVMIIKKKNW